MNQTKTRLTIMKKQEATAESNNVETSEIYPVLFKWIILMTTLLMKIKFYWTFYQNAKEK